MVNFEAKTAGLRSFEGLIFRTILIILVCCHGATPMIDLQGACRRIKEWIKENRHLKGVGFIQALNRKLQGHYNYYNVPGNLYSLWRFYKWAVECAFKWLNRRGGKRKSFTWRVFTKAIDRLGIAKPKMVTVNRKHRVFA
jgi:hypothetical protein